MSNLMLAVSTLALTLVSITMLARANDLRWRKGLAWNFRLLGFVFTGFAPFGIIGSWWTAGHGPDVYETFFCVGLALVFMTTPHLPPWWKWISGTSVEEHPKRRSTD